MKINSINEFKKYLAETYSAQDARDTFEGVLSPITIQEIENSFKTQYGVVTENDSFMYYMQLMDQKGLIIDRIVYCPTGEYINTNGGQLILQSMKICTFQLGTQ